MPARLRRDKTHRSGLIRWGRRLHLPPPGPTIHPMTGFPSRVKAVLGPTNTGKTHLAIERLMAHASGVIGFPLRLLARENYDRMVARKGVKHVALITGEEKIVPPDAKWFSCTVEAMPLDRAAEFLAVDEIQLCADADRGHVFTDRLLNARGLVGDDVPGARRPSAPPAAAPGAAGGDRNPPAAQPIAVRRAGKAGPPAAAQRRGRVQRRRGLRHRRADPAAARRLRRRHGPAVPAHPERAGRPFIRTRKWISWSPRTRSAWG